MGLCVLTSSVFNMRKIQDNEIKKGSGNRIKDSRGARVGGCSQNKCVGKLILLIMPRAKPHLNY